MEIGETLYVTSREDFRKWLEKNHKPKKEIWLVQYKKATGKPSLNYVDAVEEAICFGWTLVPAPVRCRWAGKILGCGALCSAILATPPKIKLDRDEQSACQKNDRTGKDDRGRCCDIST